MIFALWTVDADFVALSMAVRPGTPPPPLRAVSLPLAPALAASEGLSEERRGSIAVLGGLLIEHVLGILAAVDSVGRSSRRSTRSRRRGNGERRRKVLEDKAKGQDSVRGRRQCLMNCGP